MPLNVAMSAMSAAELVLWAALAVLFLSKGLHRRFRAMGSYLMLRAISTPVLTLLLNLTSKPWARDFHIGQLYYFGFFATYLASTVLLFFICIEVFRSALAAFPGIAKLAIVIFRWAAVVSVIVSLTSISYAHKGIYMIADICYGLMHSVSVLELCLLAFLCLSMNALRLTVRDVSFGIALGFGVMSSADFILASWISRVASLSDPLQFVYEGLILGTLAIWMVYFIAPEPERKPVLMPASSTIYRWNEIASALGHTGTKVAVQQPANSFFLSDVERVVEKVLARNMKGRESET
ncbi:MAG TPA: hypothetical protein VMT38_11960 [Terracidiphilus sp.]|nr:hypothetical protein [Terracidiphilus sp.]